MGRGAILKQLFRGVEVSDLRVSPSWLQNAKKTHKMLHSSFDTQGYNVSTYRSTNPPNEETIITKPRSL